MYELNPEDPTYSHYWRAVVRRYRRCARWSLVAAGVCLLGAFSDEAWLFAGSIFASLLAASSAVGFLISAVLLESDPEEQVLRIVREAGEENFHRYLRNE